MSYTIALAGQPNTGKSTIFNRLTGSKQHVGNWPGKTVAQKSGHFACKERQYEIVDLPGTYSLSANSLEEVIARDFILDRKPDLVLTVVDASQLERSLYLLSEIMLLKVPVIVALNMIDVAGRIDAAKLEEQLGLKVVPMSASKGIGIDELLEAMAGHEQRVADIDAHENLEPLTELVSGVDRFPSQWLAVKFLERDELVCDLLERELSRNDFLQLQELQVEDGALMVAGERYGWIQRITADVLDRDAEPKLSRFDRIATHHIWGLPMAIIVLFLMFVVAMLTGGPLAMGSMAALPKLQPAAIEALGSGWFGLMVSDGLIMGVGMALAMTLFLMGMYLVVAFVEDVGYMARLAFVSERFMQRLGLQGKSFLPLVMSLGCNVSGVTASRVIDSSRQRLITIVLAPMVPCGALWGTVAFMGGIFFKEKLPLLVLSMLLSVMLVIALTSFAMQRRIVPGKPTGMIMELPPYHRPNWRTIWSYVWTNTVSFVKRGATLIAAVSMLIWLLSYLPNGNLETSWLASAGRFMEPFGALMGMDWRLLVCLFAGIASKEAALAIMGVIFAGSHVSSVTNMLTATAHDASLPDILAASISAPTALAFLFAMLFSLPCIGTLGAIQKETNSLKWTFGAAIYYTAVSLVAGIIAYQVGLLIL